MSLGHFRLDGIPPAPRGVPQIEVTFDIDANGILNVNAKDKATGKEQNITITASTNLDEQEIERMVQEAKEHKDEDQKRRELIEARNAGDSLAYQTEKTLNELGDKVPASEREKVESKIKELRSALETDDTSQIKNLTEELQHAFHALSQQVYAQQQPGPQAAGPQGPSTNGQSSNGSGSERDEEGEVIEGEFTEA